MSLSKIIHPTENSSVGLWSITEQYDVLLQRVKAFGFDISVQDEYKSELKQQQWLAARCLLKEMDVGINEVLYNGLGAPSLDNGVHVSLSHSHYYVAAMLDKNVKVGIDIQHLSPKIGLIKNKFCSEEELIWSRRTDELESLHVIWSAKEAVYKWARKSGLIFKKEIKIHAFDLAEKGALSGEVYTEGKWSPISLYYEIIQDYTLVYTLNP